MLTRLRPLSFPVFAVALAASCFGGARPPELPPHGTLALGGEEASVPPSRRPFGVVFAGPRGELTGPGEISVVFNRPLRALDLAGAEPSPPVAVTAKDGLPVPGTWRWLGTSALAFIPENSLRRATAYVVTVPASTRSLAGDALTSAFTFEFRTQRLRVESASSAKREEYTLQPTSALLLRLSQPAELKAIAAHTILRATAERPASKSTRPGKPAGPALPFTLAFAKADDGTESRARIILTPKNPLALATEFELLVDEHLVGTEGTLESGKAFRETFSTYKPQALTGLSCAQQSEADPCIPGGSVYLASENPMTPQEWFAHVRLTPAVKRRVPDDELPHPRTDAYCNRLPGHVDGRRTRFVWPAIGR
jgi:alpha-2-macroglobulin